MEHNLREITDSVSQYLMYVKGMGLKGVPLSAASHKVLERWLNPSPIETLGVARETLGMVRKNLGNCRRCRLHKGRRHIVFGAGNPEARLVLVGEGPGYEEDVKGLPFVGPAGQLLTKILEAIDLKRQDVYICNIVKCRPPENRNPRPDEIGRCLPFLKRQITAIGPDLICTLGTFATQTLLKTDKPISRLRGKFHTYEGIQVLPTYHPAFLLRNPEKKRQVWEDVQKLQAAYETL